MGFKKPRRAGNVQSGRNENVGENLKKYFLSKKQRRQQQNLL